MTPSNICEQQGEFFSRFKHSKLMKLCFNGYTIFLYRDGLEYLLKIWYTYKVTSRLRERKFITLSDICEQQDEFFSRH